jgi:hypothetical protein
MIHEGQKRWELDGAVTGTNARVWKKEKTKDEMK